ncbi:MAG: FecR family protein [Treponema sp.]|jgi:hypothetical protein|nr:FecR family protein [Treponema sp.]
MKKLFLLILLLSAIVCWVSGQNGVIRELSGDVELKKAGAAAFVKASAGDAVNRDTVVSTGFKSTAVITVGSSTITVRPLTRLSLAEIQSSTDTENVNVSLQTGRVKVDVKPPAGTKANITVQSPNATASVRGTSFEFDTVNINVTEGTVVFGGSFGIPAMVQAGESSFVTTEGSAANPVDVNILALVPPPPAGVDSDVETALVPLPVLSGDIEVNLSYPSRP